jgi:hypothetical protein
MSQTYHKRSGYNGPRQSGDPRVQPPKTSNQGNKEVNTEQHKQECKEEKSLLDLWPNYLRDGYFDNNKTESPLRPEYVQREKIVPLVETMANAYPKLNSHQARRFFQHCRAIETRLRAKKADWSIEESNFLRLDMAAADARGKEQRKIPQIFHDFIKLNVAAVHTEKDFIKGFLPHFEALIGFGSAFFSKDRNS